ncbi:MAG: helix-turn-helix transcriptional regulator [Ruminococcus sp.]|nr:helix-turn-helix transcriptional regulator [Ruminococcus sp.]
MRIKELREDKKESQQKLASLLNVSQTMISRYESGQAYPDVDMLITLAKHFGVSVDYLIGVSDSKLPYTRSNLSEQEQQMLFMFKRLNKVQKEKAMSYIEGMLVEE